MRAHTLYVGASVVALAASVIGWASRSQPALRSSPPPRTPAPIHVADVRPSAAPRVELVSPAEGEDAGWLSFSSPADADAGGLSTATLHAVARGRPELRAQADVAGVQRGGRLDLRPWLRRSRPAGEYWLRYARLRASAPTRTYDTGWVTIDPLAAWDQALRVPASARTSPLHVTVATDGGLGLPGVALWIVPYPLGLSAAPVAVRTGAAGRVDVVGLDPTLSWTLQLPEGLGATRAPLETVVAPHQREALLRVPLQGAWRVESLGLLRSEVGLSQLVGRVLGPADRLLPWVTTRLVLPGEPLETDLTLLVPAGADLAHVTGLELAGYRPHPIERLEGRLRVSLDAALALPDPPGGPRGPRRPAAPR